MASFKPSLGIFRCKDYFPIPKNVFYKEEEHWQSCGRSEILPYLQCNKLACLQIHHDRKTPESWFREKDHIKHVTVYSMYLMFSLAPLLQLPYGNMDRAKWPLQSSELSFRKGNPKFREPESLIMENKQTCLLLKGRLAICVFQGFSLEKQSSEITVVCASACKIWRNMNETLRIVSQYAQAHYNYYHYNQ